MVVTDKLHQLLGSVERVDGTSVQTLFFIFLGLPIYPQASYLVMKQGGERRVMELRRNRRSVVAGYLRWWPGALGLFGAIIGGSSFTYLNDDDILFAWIVTPISVFLLLVAGLMFLLTRGSLSPEEKAQRRVYAEFANAPVDVAQLPDPWSLRDNIKRHLSDRAEGMGLTRGRPHGFGFNHWYAIALDPQMGDPQFLRAALTVARLLSAHPDANDRELGVPPQDYAQIHAALWQKLRAVQPGIVGAR